MTIKLGEETYYSEEDEPKIEYLGKWALLDEIINKIRQCQNIEEVRQYCQLFKMIYELRGDNNE